MSEPSPRLPAVRYRIAPVPFAVTLLEGLRALLLWPRAPQRQGGAPAHVLALWLLTVAVSTCGDALLLGVDQGVFNPAAVRGYAFEPLMWVLCSLWVATPPAAALLLDGHGPDAPYPAPAPLQLALPVLSAQFWLALLGYGFVVALDRGAFDAFDALRPLGVEDVADVVYAVTLAWPLLVAAAVLVRLYRSDGRPRRGAWLALPFMAVVSWLALMQPTDPLWTEPDPGDAEPEHEARAPLPPAGTVVTAARPAPARRT